MGGGRLRPRLLAGRGGGRLGYSLRRDIRQLRQPAPSARLVMRTVRAGVPGQLLDPSRAEEAGQARGGSLAALAAEHGLKPSAQRPGLGTYLRELAHRWSFIMGFATARNVAMYTEAKLGQLWQVLAPLLNAGVYLLFLVTGVFVFSFTQRVFISTSKVITDSLPLIRALQFPRAALPLAYVMIELQQLALSMAVLTMFNAGLAFFAARTGARVNDFAQLLPFLMRTWLYLSGVIYSVQQVVAAHSQHYAWATTLLQLNPAAIYLTLVRDSLLASQRASAFGARPFDPARCQAWARDAGGFAGRHPYYSAYCHPTLVSSHLWLFGAGWAVVMLVLGFWYFWRKEVFYGRG